MSIRPPIDYWAHRHVSDEEILQGWKRGLDTLSIANKYFVPESEVYNRLGRILQLDREINRW